MIRYLSFFSICGILLLLGACHPKTSSRLENQSPKETTNTSNQTIDSLPELVVELDIPEVKPVIPKKAYLMLRLEQTACYGECPVFEFKLYSDGKALWHGAHYCDRLGFYESFLPEALREQLMEKAEVIQFFTLLDHYPARGAYLSDLPNTIVYLSDGDHEKSISQNYGTPSPLLNFEKIIMGFVESLNWYEIKEEGQQ